MDANFNVNSYPFFLTFAFYFFKEVTSAPKPLINGKLAGKNEFGYHVSVEMFNISICGGGIIDDRHVVTAAHCILDDVNEFDGYPLKVVVGTEDLNVDCKQKLAVDVKQAFIPTEFDVRQQTKTNRSVGDIAVLRLSASLNLKKHKYLQKLKLPEKDESYDGKEVYVTGFGFSEYDKSKRRSAEGCGSRDNKLRYAKTVVIGHDKCQSLRKKPITSKHLCAASIQTDPRKPTGVCDGDSGGPLVYEKNELIGIVSTSPKHCREDKSPAVYTKVWPFVNFIENVRENRIDRGIRRITLIQPISCLTALANKLQKLNPFQHGRE